MMDVDTLYKMVVTPRAITYGDLIRFFVRATSGCFSALDAIEGRETERSFVFEVFNRLACKDYVQHDGTQVLYLLGIIDAETHAITIGKLTGANTEEREAIHDFVDFLNVRNSRDKRPIRGSIDRISARAQELEL